LKFGILINTDKYAKEVIGLTKAATLKGHEVILFMMDDGVKLLRNSSVVNLHKIPGVSMRFCQYSTDVIGVSTNRLAKEIVSGSQYDNAEMNREADRVIVL
jgi:sulfur relay (sulfurtransferase) complex TusBCD TusD component (DsrE family)